MRVVVAHTEDPDVDGAIDEIAEAGRAGLDGRAPVAALVYAGIGMDHAGLLRGIAKVWPGLPTIGCTTDGECSSTLCFSEDSAVVLLLTGEGLRVRTSVAQGLAADTAGTVRRAVGGLDGQAAPPLMIALGESLNVSGAGIVSALNACVPASTTVVGGTAGDQWKFSKTYQFHGDRVISDGVALMAIDGDLEVSVGVESGWKPIGRRARVTRSKGNLLYELDGKPAMERFRAWFGGHTLPSPEHPFAVFEEGAEDSYLRAPMPLDPDDGSIVCAGDIPEGAMVQVTEAGRDQILDGARNAMRQAVALYPGDQPSGMLLFSCAARKQVLGTRTHQEIEALAEVAGGTLTAGGFYTYGEIGPLRPGAHASFHNETVVAALVGS
ncbi:MAG: FIST C-terminal domain-containing protein [Myxococcales bacterium]|nr:FIST C-terminal domain-containing protein [Myxococcales bacterium]